jgi:hypothetical protein
MAKRNLPLYLLKNITIVIALVLIWRGIWYTLDGIDKFFFGSEHIYTAVGGISRKLAKRLPKCLEALKDNTAIYLENGDQE